MDLNAASQEIYRSAKRGQRPHGSVTYRDTPHPPLSAPLPAFPIVWTLDALAPGAAVRAAGRTDPAARTAPGMFRAIDAVRTDLWQRQTVERQRAAGIVRDRQRSRERGEPVTLGAAAARVVKAADARRSEGGL